VWQLLENPMYTKTMRNSIAAPLSLLAHLARTKLYFKMVLMTDRSTAPASKHQSIAAIQIGPPVPNPLQKWITAPKGRWQCH
jgi:hypothetical protein